MTLGGPKHFHITVSVRVSLSVANNTVGTKARGRQVSVMLLGAGLGIRRATSLDRTSTVAKTHFMDRIDKHGLVGMILNAAFLAVGCGAEGIVGSNTGDVGIVGVEIFGTEKAAAWIVVNRSVETNGVELFCFENIVIRNIMSRYFGHVVVEIVVGGTSNVEIVGVGSVVVGLVVRGSVRRVSDGVFVGVEHAVLVIVFRTGLIVADISIVAKRLLLLLRNIIILIDVFNGQRQANSKHALNVDGLNLHHALDLNLVARVDIKQALLDDAVSSAWIVHKLHFLTLVAADRVVDDVAVVGKSSGWFADDHGHPSRRDVKLHSEGRKGCVYA